jgi:hypothetical protein
LGQTLLADDPDYAHVFRLRDQHGRVFLDHGGIWLLELSKFTADAVETEQQRWLKFFNEAECLDENALPAWMQTQEMRRAMNTLKAFSEKEHAYHAYQARQEYLREQQRGCPRAKRALAAARCCARSRRERCFTTTRGPPAGSRPMASTPVSALQSSLAGPSIMFRYPRLVCTANGAQFRGSCHSPASD